MLLGIVTAFSAALFFALNSVMLRRGLLTGYVYSGTILSVSLGIPMYLIFSYIDHEFRAIESVSFKCIIPFIIVGILHFVIGRYLYYTSVHYAGAVISMPIMAMGQIFAAYMAIPVLNEKFTLLKLAGLLAATFGFILFISIGLKTWTVKKGITLSLISASIFAITTLIIRYGLILFKFPILGVLVSYTTALPFYLSVLVRDNIRNEIKMIEKRVLLYLILSALFVNIGQLFKYISLDMAKVIIVAPIISSEIVINLILSSIINRDLEIIETRTIAGSMAIFIGIFLIVSG